MSRGRGDPVPGLCREGQGMPGVCPDFGPGSAAFRADGAARWSMAPTRIPLSAPCRPCPLPTPPPPAWHSQEQRGPGAGANAGGRDRRGRRAARTPGECGWEACTACIELCRRASGHGTNEHHPLAGVAPDRGWSGGHTPAHRPQHTHANSQTLAMLQAAWDDDDAPASDADFIRQITSAQADPTKQGP